MVLRTFRLLAGVVLVSVLFHLLDSPAVTAPAPAYPNLRKYRFTARIKDNGGVKPFKLGELITGTFTYDLKGKNRHPDGKTSGRYHSTRNSLVFQSGGLRFSGAGEVLVGILASSHEHFGIITYDLKLPKGWDMDHAGVSKSFGIALQNDPSKEVLRRVAIPDRVTLSDFTSTRTLRLDFWGIRFPGGEVKDRAEVIAVIEKLEQIRP